MSASAHSFSRGPQASATLVKIEHAVADLRRRGISAGAASPFLFRHLWRLGVPLPPPHFLTTRQTIATSCLAFLLLGLPLRALLGSFAGGAPSWGMGVLTALGSGAVFGLLLSERHAAQARALGLPSWDDYAPNDGTSSAVSRSAR